MINYISYDNDGNILKTGKCKKENMHLQGDNVIEGIAQDDKHQIIDGQIVDKDVDNVVNNSIKLNELRQQRNMLLAETDWTQMPDSPLSEEEKENYRIYRQALRDLPVKYDTIIIKEVTFPILGEI